MSLKTDRIRVHPCPSLADVIDHLERHRFQLAVVVAAAMIVTSWTLGFFVPCISLTLWHYWTTWSFRYVFIPSDDTWTFCATVFLALPGIISFLQEDTEKPAVSRPASSQSPPLWWWWWWTGPPRTVVLPAAAPPAPSAPPAPPAPVNARDPETCRSEDTRAGSKRNETTSRLRRADSVLSALVAILMVICFVYSIYVTYRLVRDAVIDIADFQRWGSVSGQDDEEDPHEE